MRLYFIILLILPVVFSSCRRSYSSTFNLEMRYHDASGQLYASRNVKYYVKDDKIAMHFDTSEEPELSDVVMVMKGNEVFYTIPVQDEPQKVAYRMNIVDVTPSENNQFVDEGAYVIEVTEERATISGFYAYKVIAHGPQYNYIVWLTNDIPLDFNRFFNFANITPPNANGNGGYYEAEWASLIEDGFPLWIIKEPVGGLEGGFEMRVTNYLRTRIDDSFFDLSDYRIIDMTAQRGLLPVVLKY